MSAPQGYAQSIPCPEDGLDAVWSGELSDAWYECSSGHKTPVTYGELESPSIDGN